jgi:acyl dehydratase
MLFASMRYAEPGDELAEGLLLRSWRTVVTEERQHRYHEAAEIPPGLFGDTADLSILASDTIRAMRYLKSTPMDGLHAGQRMEHLAAVRLGEPLVLRGHVARLRQSAKGRFASTAFVVQDADGTARARGELHYFRVNPGARVEPGGADRPFDRAGWTSVARKALTPQRVAAYSHEFPDYRVHFDPEIAAAVGLRAPVAQGLMSFSWMMQAIAEDGLPERFALSATFRRPIFWDETVEVLRREAELAVVGEDGRLRSAGALELNPPPAT